MTDQKDDASEELEREIYLSHRKSIDELRISQLNVFDKSILTLSSAALGFSVILLSAFATQGGLVAMKYLAISWILFVLTIALNLISYHTGAESARIDIDQLDQRMRNQKSFKELPNKWKTRTHYLNRAVIASFTVGAICLLFFASANAVAMDTRAAAKEADKPSVATQQPVPNVAVPVTPSAPQGNTTPPILFPGGLPSEPSPTGITPSPPPVPRPGGAIDTLPSGADTLHDKPQ